MPQKRRYRQIGSVRAGLDAGLLSHRLDTLSRVRRAVEAELRVEAARPLPDTRVLGRLRHAEARLSGQIAMLSRMGAPKTLNL